CTTFTPESPPAGALSVYAETQWARFPVSSSRYEIWRNDTGKAAGETKPRSVRLRWPVLGVEPRILDDPIAAAGLVIAPNGATRTPPAGTGAPRRFRMTTRRIRPACRRKFR